MTYTFLENGEFVPSLISILRDGNYLSEDYAKKAHNLFNHYHKIEIDNEIPLNQKIIEMENWWESHAKLRIESKLNKSDIIKVSKSNKIKFREFLPEILEITFQNNIPFIILSASGLGYISIIETLKSKKIYFKNIEVISNKHIWDNNGFAIDFIKPHIHTFNKNENIIKNNSEIYNKIKTRKNIILLGDSLGDSNMAKENDNVLKIGFLNFNIDENLENYKKYYDVIIINDSSMEFVYNLLKEFKN